MEVVGAAVSELEGLMSSITSSPELIALDAGSPPNTFRYRIFRYAPNVERDEWVNIGVLLEDIRTGRLAVRLAEGDSPEFARVKRLQPDLDEELLRALPGELSERLRASSSEVAAYLDKLNQSLSNAVQLSPAKALLAESFEAEMDRLYRIHVLPPARHGGVMQSVRDFLREKLTDVFRRHRVLGRMESRVPVEGFTHPGDTFRFEFGYQNGVRGFVHTIAMKNDLALAKVVSYTAGRVHAKDASAEVTAITDIAPDLENRRHRFVADILAEQNVRIVPMPQVERFAEELRVRLN
jgi:hypothetical protein